MLHTLTDITGQDHVVHVNDDRLVDVINHLKACRRGGFATIHAYISGLGNAKCIKPEISDVNFISRFSYKTRNLKRLALLQTVTMDMVDVDNADLFDKARAELVKSAEATRDDVSDARRDAHRKFYVSVTEGVTVHLQTKKVYGGQTKLVLVGGKPVVESIMVRGLEMHKKVLAQGVYKPTNSHAKTIVKRAIERWLDSKTGSFKNYKLTPDRFDRLSIGGDAVVSDELREVIE